MLHQIVWLATVTILGVLEQAYFAMQVIYVRRKCKVPPPGVAGPPEFERIFRAQVNCSEYFPIFLSLLWVAGVFFHQGCFQASVCAKPGCLCSPQKWGYRKNCCRPSVSAALCGLIYLYARYQYFNGYACAAQGRLGPMYFSSGVLCVLIGLSVVGLFIHFMPLTFLIP